MKAERLFHQCFPLKVIQMNFYKKLNYLMFKSQYKLWYYICKSLNLNVFSFISTVATKNKCLINDELDRFENNKIY